MHLYKVYSNGQDIGPYYVWAFDSLSAKIALKGHINRDAIGDIVRVDGRYAPAMVLIEERL